MITPGLHNIHYAAHMRLAARQLTGSEVAWGRALRGAAEPTCSPLLVESQSGETPMHTMNVSANGKLIMLREDMTIGQIAMAIQRAKQQAA